MVYACWFGTALQLLMPVMPPWFAINVSSITPPTRGLSARGAKLQILNTCSIVLPLIQSMSLCW